MGQDLRNILVIKLGALGDFIQALGPMAAIRRAHPQAHITLLTTKLFEGFAEGCGYFDQILLDERPGIFDFKGWLSLRKILNKGDFERVYDLQNNDRTALYFKLFSPRPEWVGVAKGATHRNVSPGRVAGHAFDGHVQTLALAGITDVQVDPLAWMDGDVSVFNLTTPYVVLVPGCAPERPEKRWSAAHYGRLAKLLVEQGFQPVIIGTKAEEEAALEIKTLCPDALDLTSQTSFAQIAALGRGAAGAIGNDTGPMHLLGASGCSCLVLFSSHSDPVRHAPKGADVKIIQRDALEDLEAEDVLGQFGPCQLLKTPSAAIS